MDLIKGDIVSWVFVNCILYLNVPLVFKMFFFTTNIFVGRVVFVVEWWKTVHFPSSFVVRIAFDLDSALLYSTYVP
jgi:hypothetical protein